VILKIARALDCIAEIAKKFCSQITILTVVPTIMIPIFPMEGLTPLTAAESFLGYQERMREIYVKSLE